MFIKNIYFFGHPICGVFLKHLLIYSFFIIVYYYFLAQVLCCDSFCWTKGCRRIMSTSSVILQKQCRGHC